MNATWLGNFLVMPAVSTVMSGSAVVEGLFGIGRMMLCFTRAWWTRLERDSRSTMEVMKNADSLR